MTASMEGTMMTIPRTYLSRHTGYGKRICSTAIVLEETFRDPFRL